MVTFNSTVLNRKVSILNKSYRVTTFQGPDTCPCCGRKVEVRDALHMEWRTYSALRKGRIAMLTRQQFITLNYLAGLKEPVPTARIINKLYEGDIDGGPDSLKVIDVVVSKLNRKIAPLKLKIAVTNRGPGAMRYLEFL